MSKKQFRILLIAILLLVCCGAGIALFYQYSHPSDEHDIEVSNPLGDYQLTYVIELQDWKTLPQTVFGEYSFYFSEDLASANVTTDTSPADVNTNADTGTDSESQRVSSDVLTATGYLLDIENNLIYVDLENPGGRTYPGEGEDRAVVFDISEAAIPVHLANCVTVTISYRIENQRNLATYVYSDGDEKEPVWWADLPTGTGSEDTGTE